MEPQKLEKNVVNSFQAVKDDMLYVRDMLVYLQNEIETLKNAKKVVVVKKKEKIVASKASTKMHKESCVFAKNIKSRNKKVFSNKSAALLEGLQACACIA